MKEIKHFLESCVIQKSLMQYIFIDHEKSWTRISHDSTAHGKSRRKWCRVLRQPRDPSRISVVHKQHRQNSVIAFLNLGQQRGSKSPL